MNTWPLGLARLLQQRQKTAAPLHVQFAHHVVNQQNRRRAVDAGEIFRLRHLQRDGQRAFLAFAAELRGGFFVEQQLQIVAVRPDERGAIRPFARRAIAPVPRRNPFSRSADIRCAIPPRRWKCGDTPAAPAAKISAPVRGAARMISSPSFTSSREKLSSAASSSGALLEQRVAGADGVHVTLEQRQIAGLRLREQQVEKPPPRARRALDQLQILRAKHHRAQHAEIIGRAFSPAGRPAPVCVRAPTSTF